MAKINERSTKSDIWKAYRQLLTELEQRTVTVSEDPAKLKTMIGVGPFCCSYRGSN